MVSWLAVIVWAVATVSVAQDLPKIEGESLASHHVVLPDAASGKVAVLVLGFSKASKTPTSAWGQRIETDFAETPDLVLYQLPVLEDVPGFIRGMVISNIKKGAGGTARLLRSCATRRVRLEETRELKEPDDAYLILLDRSGNIAYQMHGALSETSYAELHQRIVALLR